jgi:hypothetical protein
MMSGSKRSGVAAGAAVAAVFYLWSGQAHAHCNEDPNFTINPGGIECWPDLSGSNNHDVLAVIGSDDSGQWIGWFDMSTNECAGWDPVGSVQGFSQDIRLASQYGNDWFETVVEPGTWFCDFPLNPPVTNGYVLYMGNGLYSQEGGGYDTFISHIASRTNFTGLTLDGTYIWTENVGFMLLSDGPDTVVAGTSYVYVATYAGDDEIISSSSTAEVSCGDGWDLFNGPGFSAGCEYSCADWPFNTDCTEI